MARLHMLPRPDTIRAAYCTVLYEECALMMRSSLPTEYVEYAQSIRLRLHMIRCESVCARVTVYVSVRWQSRK